MRKLSQKSRLQCALFFCETSISAKRARKVIILFLNLILQQYIETIIMRESQRLMDAGEAGKVDAYSNPTPEVAILWDSIPKSKFGLYATLVVEVAVVAFLIIVVFVDIYVKHPGTLSTTDHALYITGITIIASAISTLGTSQIRLYWLARILPAFKPFETSGVQSHLARGRTVLGLGTWQQQIHHRLVALSMIVAGLTTAAIVAATSPTMALVDQRLTAGVTSDDLSFDFDVSPNYDGDWFNWELSNGSYLNLNTSLKKFHYSSSPVRMVPDYIDAPSPIGFPYAVQEFVGRSSCNRGPVCDLWGRFSYR